MPAAVVKGSVLEPASSVHAGTTLPVVEQIMILVRHDDTPETIIRRATKQAAASVGLDAQRQRAFADRSGSSLIWQSEKPSLGSDNMMRGGDTAATASQSVIFRLSGVSERSRRRGRGRRSKQGRGDGHPIVLER